MSRLYFRIKVSPLCFRIKVSPLCSGPPARLRLSGGWRCTPGPTSSPGPAGTRTHGTSLGSEPWQDDLSLPGDRQTDVRQTAWTERDSIRFDRYQAIILSRLLNKLIFSSLDKSSPSAENGQHFPVFPRDWQTGIRGRLELI